MVRIYSLFPIFALAAFFGVSPSEQGRCDGLNASTLQFTHVLFRHGDRTPVTPYPNDPYNSYWATWGPPGQLTDAGIEQDFFAGKWLRECYDGFLSPTYKLPEVYVRSSGKNRCLESAEAHCAGLFPPNFSKTWSLSPSARVARFWRPIPVQTVPTSEDYLLISTITCPVYDQLQKDAWSNIPELAAVQANNQDLLTFIASNAGYPVPGQLSDISANLWDPVIIEKRAGLNLPAWIDKTVLRALREWKDLWVRTEINTDQMIKFSAGTLVADLIDTLTKKSNGTLTQDIYLYSSHSDLLAGLLAVYKSIGYVYDLVEPPFGSHIITELHRDNAKWFVKPFYVLRNATPQPISGPIPLNTFINKIKKYRLDNKAAACIAP